MDLHERRLPGNIWRDRGIRRSFDVEQEPIRYEQFPHVSGRIHNPGCCRANAKTS